MHLVDALSADDRVQCILGLHETVCTGAADGYARMKGQAACTLLHLGPGGNHRSHSWIAAEYPWCLRLGQWCCESAQCPTCWHPHPEHHRGHGGVACTHRYCTLHPHRGPYQICVQMRPSAWTSRASPPPSPGSMQGYHPQPLAQCPLCSHVTTPKSVEALAVEVNASVGAVAYPVKPGSHVYLTVP